MVNTKNVSKYTGRLPISDRDGARKIAGGPLYSESDVSPLLDSSGSKVNAWTKKCITDMQKNCLEAGDVADLIGKCFTNRRSYFKGSEWCQQKENGPWAACDAYQLFVEQWNEHAHRYMEYEFYVKFAIALSGRVILTISCHGPEEKS